ncbi:MAG: hypothetical protein ABWK15_05920 [Dissulfuribacterales bacterium]
MDEFHMPFIRETEYSPLLSFPTAYKYALRNNGFKAFDSPGKRRKRRGTQLS